MLVAAAPVLNLPRPLMADERDLLEQLQSDRAGGMHRNMMCPSEKAAIKGLLALGLAYKGHAPVHGSHTKTLVCYFYDGQ